MEMGACLVLRRGPKLFALAPSPDVWVWAVPPGGQWMRTGGGPCWFLSHGDSEHEQSLSLLKVGSLLWQQWEWRAPRDEVLARAASFITQNGQKWCIALGLAS